MKIKKCIIEVKDLKARQPYAPLQKYIPSKKLYKRHKENRLVFA
jgi:hypothetical protein